MLRCPQDIVEAVAEPLPEPEAADLYCLDPQSDRDDGRPLTETQSLPSLVLIEVSNMHIPGRSPRADPAMRCAPGSMSRCVT